MITTTPLRGVNRRKLKSIALRCCDPTTTDALDRAIARGPVSKSIVKRIAHKCCDHRTTDALDALVAKQGHMLRQKLKVRTPDSGVWREAILMDCRGGQMYVDFGGAYDWICAKTHEIIYL